MAPLVCFTKIHHCKYGFVKMENLDETGLRFYLHSNKLVDKPILLFPSGMVKLIRALPEVYEIYDQQALIRAEMVKSDGGDEAALAAEDEVLYTLNIATTKVLQINLEISLYKGKLYIFVKKSSWADDELIWRPCRGTFSLDRYQDDPEALLSFVLSAHNDAAVDAMVTAPTAAASPPTAAAPNFINNLE
jgi:hypothetical protein